MSPDRPRAGIPVTALLLLGLFGADLRGLVDLTAVVRSGGTVVAVWVLEGGEVLASMVPTLPKAPTPRRRRRPAAKAEAGPAPGSAARGGIPGHYLRLYREAGAGEVWVDRAGRRYAAWAVLAAIGSVESGHGQSRAPGVHSGVNAFGCCAGPMQFNLRNGPPSTWDTWGRGNVYDPRDAIPAAARKLRGDGARRDLDGALLAYNNDYSGYVVPVKAQARRYQG
jgi:hypothetical protein